MKRLLCLLSSVLCLLSSAFEFRTRAANTFSGVRMAIALPPRPLELTIRHVIAPGILFPVTEPQFKLNTNITGRCRMDASLTADMKQIVSTWWLTNPPATFGLSGLGWDRIPAQRLFYRFTVIP